MKIFACQVLIFVTVFLTSVVLFEHLPSLLCGKVICDMAVRNEVTFVLCMLHCIHC